MPERYLKSIAPSAFVSAVQKIEDLADACYQELEALTLPRNLALWGVLVGIIGRIEDAIAANGFGTPAHTAVMQNLSRAGSQVNDWLQKYGKGAFVRRRDFKYH